MEMSPCPTCGEVFDTDRGVKIHHSKIHGESIAGEVIECGWCGETFRAPESDDREFCSRECASKWLSENRRGADCYQYAKVELECDWCGEPYKRAPANAEGSRFCSRECQSKAQSEEFAGADWHLHSVTGEDHPSFTGHPDYYGENWSAQRENALDRDGYKCAICGMTNDAHRDTHGCELHVHHIEPLATFDTKVAANDLDNLLTLCRPCHAKWEGIPVVPEEVRHDGRSNTG